MFVLTRPALTVISLCWLQKALDWLCRCKNTFFPSIYLIDFQKSSKEDKDLAVFAK